MNSEKLIVLTASLLVLTACNKSPSAPTEVNAQVRQYISKLPQSQSASDTTMAMKTDWFARKDTLKPNGLIIMGNWTPGNANVACTQTNTMGLSLTNIDHIEDLAPCPDGVVLVRAVMKN